MVAAVLSELWAEPSNTAPLKSTEYHFSKVFLDWLSLSLYIDQEGAEDFFKHLAACQITARENGVCQVEIAPGVVASVMPSGFGRGYSHCPYAVDVWGLRVGFTGKNTANRPNCYIDAGGEVFLRYGSQGVVQLIEALLTACRCVVRQCQLRRLDVSCDVLDRRISPQTVYTAWEEERTVTRCDLLRPVIRRRKVESVYVGEASAHTQLRIYDKLAELTKGGDQEKLILHQANRWGGEKPAQVTRVEFQLRKEALQKYGIRLVGQLNSICNVWYKLCTEFFRLIVEPVRHNNYDLTTVEAWWQELADNGETVDVFEPFQAGTIDIPPHTSLQKQGLGTLAAALVRSDVKVESKDEAKRLLLRLAFNPGAADYLFRAYQKKVVGRRCVMPNHEMIDDLEELQLRLFDEQPDEALEFSNLRMVDAGPDPWDTEGVDDQLMWGM